MRVWIYSDRRWGDSDETRWTAEVWIDPHPEREPDEAIDRATGYFEAFKSKRAAIAGAKRMKSNLFRVAQVRKQELEQLEGTSFDWHDVGELEEVKCILTPAPSVAP